MATTGVKPPTLGTSVSETGHAGLTWTSPTFIVSDNATSATDTTHVAFITSTSFDLNIKSFVLKATGFDFSAIPANATITGVRVTINAWGDGDSSLDLAQLLDVSRVRVGTNLLATPVQLPNAGTTNVVTLGVNGNLWGNALTVAWVKDADFGVGIGANATANNAQVRVDYIFMEVFYTVPQSIAGNPATENDSATVGVVTQGSPKIVNGGIAPESDSSTIGKTSKAKLGVVAPQSDSAIVGKTSKSVVGYSVPELDSATIGKISKLRVGSTPPTGTDVVNAGTIKRTVLGGTATETSQPVAGIVIHISLPDPPDPGDPGELEVREEYSEFLNPVSMGYIY